MWSRLIFFLFLSYSSATDELLNYLFVFGTAAVSPQGFGESIIRTNVYTRNKNRCWCGVDEEILSEFDDAIFVRFPRERDIVSLHFTSSFFFISFSEGPDSRLFFPRRKTDYFDISSLNRHMSSSYVFPISCKIVLDDRILSTSSAA